MNFCLFNQHSWITQLDWAISVLTDLLLEVYKWINHLFLPSGIALLGTHSICDDMRLQLLTDVLEHSLTQLWET
jgi:hypothetical protein